MIRFRKKLLPALETGCSADEVAQMIQQDSSGFDEAYSAALLEHIVDGNRVDIAAVVVDNIHLLSKYSKDENPELKMLLDLIANYCVNSARWLLKSRRVHLTDEGEELIARTYFRVYTAEEAEKWMADHGFSEERKEKCRPRRA